MVKRLSEGEPVLDSAKAQVEEQPVPSNTIDKSSTPAIKSVKDGRLEIDLEYLRKFNIFFATPCYGGMITDQYFLSMFRTTQELMKLGINFRITTLRNESLVTRARNILVAMFMESPCTHLMFIDSDIEWQPDSIIRMLAIHKPIVAAAYPKKTVNWGSVKAAAERGEKDLEHYQADYAINLQFNDPENKRVEYKDGAIKVLDASTGFFMIQRETIEKMMNHHPELHYKNDSHIDPKFNKYCYSLFDTMHDPKDNRYLSEDYTFCRRWQQMGGDIWLDPSTSLNHVGSYTFAGNPSRMFKSSEQ